MSGGAFTIELLNGDCLDVLKAMEANSVDSVVCDPPYGLSNHTQEDMFACLRAWLNGEIYSPTKSGFMGKAWDAWVPGPEVWREVLRVLKPGGHLLCFGGSRTVDLMGIALRLAGFEIRDTIMYLWVYGQGFPKSRNIGKDIEKVMVGGIKNLKQTGTKKGIKVESGTQGFSYSKEYVAGKSMGGKQVSGDIPVYEINNEWSGWGTALKPSQEPIILARKPLCGTVAENVLAFGTGGLNIDGCRVEANGEANPSIERRKSKPPINNVWEDKRSPESYATVRPSEQLGRWPANIIHDGGAEVLAGFPQNYNRNDGTPYIYSGKEYNNRSTSMFNGDKPQSPSNYNDTGSAARFFYCAKASKSDRDEGLDGMPKYESYSEATATPQRDLREQTYRANNHPCVKPSPLMRYLCKLVTPPGGVVLDPFMGSGSTGKAAVMEGFSFIGIEREAEYLEIARARINHAAGIAGLECDTNWPDGVEIEYDAKLNQADSKAVRGKYKDALTPSDLFAQQKLW